MLLRRNRRAKPPPFSHPPLRSRVAGRTLTDFVVATVQEAAQHAIEQAEVTRLSLADQQRFAEALLTPPRRSPALQRAMARHDKLLRTE
ncbi:type II toxin-antitoxin system TacA family antitoxin [Cupriavidus necator]